MSLTRPARAEDMPAIADIVNPYIATTAIHFGDAPQTADDWHAKWSSTADRYPWFVHMIDGQVCGVAYGAPYRDRRAYDWTAEVTVYSAVRGQGVGRALYATLIPALEARGIRTLIAGVTLPNPASVGLHEAFGFTPIGVIRQAGFKFGQWHDVGFWQRILSTDPPAAADS